MQFVTSAEYNDKIQTCLDLCFAIRTMPCRSSYEQRCDIQRLQDKVHALKDCRMHRISERDSRRGASAIEWCQNIIDQKHVEFKRQDALICKLAFAEEWR